MLDIFRDSNTGALWVGTAEDMEEAQIMARKLFASNPGRYFLFDLANQTRHVIKPEDLGNTGEQKASA
jgi:hypothetical protein